MCRLPSPDAMEKPEAEPPEADAPGRPAHTMIWGFGALDAAAAGAEFLAHAWCQRPAVEPDPTSTWIFPV